MDHGHIAVDESPQKKTEAIIYLAKCILQLPSITY